MNEETIYKNNRISKESKRFAKTVENNQRFDKKKNYKNINGYRSKTTYFDSVEISRIEYFIKRNHIHALERIESYIEKYPEDYYGIILYSGLLIINRRFDEARIVLDKLETNLYSNPKFLNDVHTVDKKIYDLAYSNFKYYLYKGDLEAAYNYYRCNSYLVKNRGLEQLYFYIFSKLNKEEAESLNLDSYIYNQIIDYDYDEMRKHIEKHLMDCSINNNNVFVREFPIENVLNEIQQYLVDENALYTGLFEDTYYFKLDNCGKVSYKYTNYFKVVCFHGTKNIITMLPITDEYNEVNLIDLNYMNKAIDFNTKNKSNKIILKINCYRNNKNKYIGCDL